MRDAKLRAAGYNMLDFDPEQVELDFFTDALERSAVESVRRAEAQAVLAGVPHPGCFAHSAATHGSRS